MRHTWLVVLLVFLSEHLPVLGQNPPCYLCGDDGVSTITNPDVVIPLPSSVGIPSASCEMIRQAGEVTFLISTANCPLLNNEQLQIACGCENFLTAPTAPSVTTPASPTSKPIAPPSPAQQPIPTAPSLGTVPTPSSPIAPKNPTNPAPRPTAPAVPIPRPATAPQPSSSNGNAPRTAPIAPPSPPTPTKTGGSGSNSTGPTPVFQPSTPTFFIPTMNASTSKPVAVAPTVPSPMNNTETRSPFMTLAPTTTKPTTESPTFGNLSVTVAPSSTNDTLPTTNVNNTETQSPSVSLLPSMSPSRTRVSPPSFSPIPPISSSKQTLPLRGVFTSNPVRFLSFVAVAFLIL